MVTFHSLEDRIVKRFMRDRASDRTPARVPLRASELPEPELRVVGKAQRADDTEIAANPRARSAVMRVAMRLPQGGHA